MSKPIKICFANVKGGCAKTTSVIAIGSALAKQGHRVLLVDWDFQGSLTEGLGLSAKVEQEQKSIADAIAKDATFEAIRIPTYLHNLDLLGNDVRFAEVVHSFHGRARQFHLFRNLLDTPAIEEYDFVLVDTHPHIDAHLQSALAGCDWYLIPAFSEKSSFTGIRFLTEVAGQVRSDLNPELKLLGCFLCNFKRASSNQREIERESQEFSAALDLRIFQTRIPHSDAVGKSYSRCISVIDHAPSLPITKAYLNLTNELIAATGGPNGQT